MNKSELLKREVIHQGDAELNCMTLHLTNGLAGVPHFNKGREESVCVISGEVDVLIFHDDKIVKHSLSHKQNQVIWLPANVIHIFNVVSDEAIVLENIAGKFKEGCCVNADIDSWYDSIKLMYQNGGNEYYYDVSS